MKCVECGAHGSFWLCSNDCTVAYAQKRGRRNCAICSYDAKSGRIGRHDTARVCPECRAHSENRGWCENRQEEADDAVETRLEENERLRDQQDRSLPEVTPLVRQIATMIVEGEAVPYEYRDRKGRPRGIRYRRRAYTIRRLAKALNCPKATVQRVIESIEQ